MTRRKSLWEDLFSESDPIGEDAPESSINWDEITAEPPALSEPRRKRETASGGLTASEKEFCSRWNATVNLFRAYYGLPLFKENYK